MRKIKVECQCGHAFQHELKDGWFPIETPYGIAVYPPADRRGIEEFYGSYLLRCPRCNRERSLKIVKNYEKRSAQKTLPRVKDKVKR